VRDVLWERLPLEMRERNQWCVAGPDKAPQILGNSGLHNASPVKGPWMSFEKACQVARQYDAEIGYVLTTEDGITCIDLDVKDSTSKKPNGEPVPPKDWTTVEELAQYREWIQFFGSYAERSVSGRGVHILVKGDIGAGVRRGGVELYSTERFIVCTGDTVSDVLYSVRDNVVRCEPLHTDPFHLADCNDQINIMAFAYRSSQGVQGSRSDYELVELEPVESDETIMQRAREAANNSKFSQLYDGDWSGYKSQSEADLSLMSMFTFYSKSNEQCRRLFRSSGLGKREKAVCDNRYIDLTLKLVRQRQDREAERAKQSAEQAKELVSQLVSKMNSEASAAISGEVLSTDRSLPQSASDLGDGLDWPPGVAGAIAKFIYRSAPRPAKEVGIVAALGLLAGICGRSFHIPQSGLNLYIILVARSGVGKEAMHTGISLIVNKVMDGCPVFNSFIDFDDFASGQSLTRVISEKPSFVNVGSEWGRKLKRLAHDDGKGEGPMQSLRTTMTALYQKSGPSSIVGGISYSKADKNVASISSAAYSMIGETTPSTFFESLTDSMMEDGFLSRFLIIEYNGNRPPLNETPVLEPEPALVKALQNMAFVSSKLNAMNNSKLVAFDPDAMAQLKAFDKRCDDEINSSDDESWRQMWNRAHLKAYRIAALLAAADNPEKPCATTAHTEWALMVVQRDIKLMTARMQSGEIGQGTDDKRVLKILEIASEVFKNGYSKGYNLPAEFAPNGILARSFLQVRISRIKMFKEHRVGTGAALDSTLRLMIENGYIEEINRDTLIAEYGRNYGKCYRVINWPSTY